MKRRLPTVAAAFALLVVACQVVIGLEEPKGVDAADDAAVDSGDPCKHQRPPPPPAKDDNAGLDKAYWLAATHVTVPLKADDAGVHPGFDLDNACTCFPDLHDGGPPCVTPAAANACDFPNGVDDSFGQTFTSVAAPYPGFDILAPVNSELDNGTRTFMIYLKHYNDAANDTDVGVQFVNSGGLYTNKGCDDTARDMKVTFADPSLGKPNPYPDVRYAPLRDGCDRWSPDEGQTVGSFPNRSTQQTLPGYVTNFDLVVSFKDLTAALFGGTSSITDGVAVAHLSKDANGKLHASGVVSGRMAFADLIDLVGHTSVSFGADSAQPFCQTYLWSLGAPRFCQARDTMATPSLEFTGATCDAASAAIGFDFVEAQVSDVEFTNVTGSSDCANAPKITCQ